MTVENLYHVDLISDTELRPFLTSPRQALLEIHKRKNMPLLRKAVEDYLLGDIPSHFQGDTVAYLARHVATPNFETLRFIEMAKQMGLPSVIGEDSGDIFVSQNSLKRALGKMPVIKGRTQNLKNIIEHFTVVDFATAQGKQLRCIDTFFGEPLMEFHLSLLRTIYPHEVSVCDESAWIDRHCRGNLIEHYKRLLSLFVVHGIMFEYYPTHEASENDFVSNVLLPAFGWVEANFGKRPLIVPLIPKDLESEENWEAYPSVLYKIVKTKVARGNLNANTTVPYNEGVL